MWWSAGLASLVVLIAGLGVGIRTGHILPTVMSLTPSPSCCLVTWHVELFCGSSQWGGVWMMLLFLFLVFHFVAVIGGSLTGFNGFHFSLETRVLWDLPGIKEKPVGVSVVATVASWMYNGNHPKIIQDQIIPFHVLPSSDLKEPILVQGWDWKLDIFGVQFCSRPFHVSRLLLTMQIWVWKVVAENGGQLCSTTLAFCLVVCSHIYHIPLFSQAMFLPDSYWYSKPKHSYVNCCNCFSALYISFG